MTQQVSPQEAAKWLASGEALLIDVRENDEFRSEHIVYANSLPLSDFRNLIRHMDVPAARKIVFQCQKGGRGEQACLLTKDIKALPNDIYNLAGGLAAWKDAGLPVAGISSQGVSVFRQVQIIVGGIIALMVALGFAGLTLAFLIAGFFGLALLVAGLTGWCGLALLLAKMPWNK